MKQAKEIVNLKIGCSIKSRGPSSSKRWTDYSRQHQWKKKKGLANSIQTALSFCDSEGFKPCSVEIENIDTGAHKILDINTRSFNESKRSPSENILFIQLCISRTGFQFLMKPTMNLVWYPIFCLAVYKH